METVWVEDSPRSGLVTCSSGSPPGWSSYNSECRVPACAAYSKRQDYLSPSLGAAKPNGEYLGVRSTPRIALISDIHGNCEALKALPRDYDELGVLGDLVNYGQQSAEVIDFVKQDISKWRNELALAGTDFLCVGHTHMQFSLQEGEQSVINPGSIGQPKTGTPEAKYAILENRSVTFRVCDYPVERNRGARPVDAGERGYTRILSQSAQNRNRSQPRERGETCPKLLDLTHRNSRFSGKPNDSRNSSRADIRAVQCTNAPLCMRRCVRRGYGRCERTCGFCAELQRKEEER